MSADAMLHWLGHTAWQVCVLAAVVFLIDRFAGRRLPPRVVYGLWWVVVLRLFLPIQPEVPSAAIDWKLSSWSASADELEQVASTRRLKQTDEDQRDETNAESESPASVERDEVLEAAPVIGPKTRPRSSQATLSARGEDPTNAGLAAEAIEHQRSEEARDTSQASIVIFLWLAVTTCLLLRDGLLERAFRKVLRRADEIRDPRILALFDEVRQQAGVRKAPALIETPSVAVPSLCGFLRPRLCLPSETLQRASDAELQHIFAHELAHLKSGDVLANLLLLFARRVFWFHPLVPFVVRRLRAAQESVRDWDALRFEDVPANYARTLLTFSGQATRARHAASVGFLHGDSNLKRRILMITRFGRTTRVSTIGGVALVLAFSWLTFTTAATPVGAAPTENSAVHGPQRIVGVSSTEPEDWRRVLNERLDQTRVSVSFDAFTLAEVVAILREASTINYVIDSEYLANIESTPIQLQAQSLTMRLARANGSGSRLVLAP